MATSAVPAAVDALLAILQAAPALSGVSVLDGPPAVDLAVPDFVAVGWVPDTDVAVDITQAFASAGARTRDEDFAITCWAESWTGDNDVAARRRRVFALLAAVEDALRATNSAPTAPTLNGTVLWAGMTRGTYQQALTDRGVRTGIAFTVTCRARI